MKKKNTVIEKNNPRILNAWASYDWANSVYNLAITAAIFPVYYESTTKEAFQGEVVKFFGMDFIASVLYAYAISLSFLLAAILSPLLSGLADYGGLKKAFMKIFTYTGATACMCLFFFKGANVEYGIIMALIASMGFSGALVFYNSYLPDIATDDRLDSVSAKGFSLGFLGSVIQLTISLAIIFNAETLFGKDSTGFATRFSFLLVGIWWIGFAQIAFFYLPKNVYKERTDQTNLVKKGFKELLKVWESLRGLPNLKRFLAAFFFYNMGAQSIFLLATIFGSKELNLPPERLIGVILLLQLVGIGGAYVFANVSARRGNKFALLSMLVGWTLICVFGYMIDNEVEFYILAASFGFVMGGIHLSRSTYAKLIPQDTRDTTSYFSFYDVTEKLATALGPFSYGIIELLTGDMHFSLIALGIYFIVGMVILARVSIPRGMGGSE
ncbi:MAG: MFS transporter [Microscillaceae bacterium]|nr:MFS transporter [Microscillaceae bacterium]